MNWGSAWKACVEERERDAQAAAALRKEQVASEHKCSLLQQTSAADEREAQTLRELLGLRAAAQ